MSNEIYTDLERDYLRSKHQFKSIKYIDASRQLDTIKELVHQFPNDMELGAKVREFINLHYIK